MTWREMCLSLGRAFLKRECLAFVALTASIVGAAVLTIMLAYAIYALRGAAQWEVIGNLAYGLLVSVVITQVSLGFMLTKRSFEAEFWKIKFKANGGESGEPE